jgi:hypothetical protein
VSAAVVHPASLHLVNILIVSYGLHIVKLDDPKAFCMGELLYPIYAHCSPGLNHMEKYAPYGKQTRWCITGAIWIDTGKPEVLREVFGSADRNGIRSMPVRQVSILQMVNQHSHRGPLAACG